MVWDGCLIGVSMHKIEYESISVTFKHSSYLRPLTYNIDNPNDCAEIYQVFEKIWDRENERIRLKREQDEYCEYLRLKEKIETREIVREVQQPVVKDTYFWSDLYLYEVVLIVVSFIIGCGLIYYGCT